MKKIIVYVLFLCISTSMLAMQKYAASTTNGCSSQDLKIVALCAGISGCAGLSIAGYRYFIKKPRDLAHDSELLRQMHINVEQTKMSLRLFPSISEMIVRNRLRQKLENDICSLRTAKPATKKRMKDILQEPLDIEKMNEASALYYQEMLNAARQQGYIQGTRSGIKEGLVASCGECRHLIFLSALLGSSILLLDYILPKR